MRTSLSLLILVGVLAASGPARAQSLQMLLPLYSYPDWYSPATYTWGTVAAAESTIPITAIINPNSGPTATPNSDYIYGMTQLQTAGVKMIGYVPTGYGADPIGTVEQEIHTYSSAYTAAGYSVTGIFLDEASTSPTNLSYYTALYNYIKNQPNLNQVIINPGTNIPESYISAPAADTTVISENPSSAWVSYATDSYVANYSSQRFAAITTDTPTVAQMETDINLAVQRNVGYTYVTDQTTAGGADPYEALPSYFSQEISYLASVSQPSSPAAFWTGTIDNLWTSANWAATAAGSMPAVVGRSTDVTFSVTAGGANLNTTLGQNITIHSLTIGDTNPVIISSGAGGPYTLTIAGNVGTGIDVESGAALFTLNANLALAGASNTITVNNTAGAVITGVVGGINGLIKAGAGTLTLTAANTYIGSTTIDAGALQLGNGGTTGSINSLTSVSGASGATLIFNRSDSPVFSIPIGGGIGVTQAGPGYVWLTANNSYTGATAINAGGIVVGGNGASGSLGTGNVVNKGILYFHRSDIPTVSNVISGSGAVVQNGTGGVTLTGANIYTGITEILAGSLQLGNNGATGSLGTGSVTNNGILYFDHSNNPAVSNVISGSGAVIQEGSGYVYLTGNNTYTGATTINAGGIVVGGNGVSGSLGTGSVVNKGILYFDHSNTPTVGNIISGSGAVVQDGSGGVTLTGINTYTGVTAVDSGTLLVNGSISGSTTTVNSGGTLAGDGTVGAVKAVSGGTVLPGSISAGGLLRTGNLSLASGASLSLELGGTTGTGTAATLYGEVKATGAVTLGGAAQISLFGGFTPVVNDVFYAILNDGSDPASGKFSNAPGNIITAGGVEYQVNYAANGDGGAVANDVSLTVIAVPDADSPQKLAVPEPAISINQSLPEPGMWTLLLSAFALLSGCKRHRRARAAWPQALCGQSFE